MICTQCGRAADQRAPRNQHCDDPGCTCGHQVQRYGTTTGGAPAGLYEQMMAMFGVPLPPYAAPPKGSCPCGGGDFDGESIHAPDCPVHPVRLRAAEAAATATLPPEMREAGIHFAYDTTTGEQQPELTVVYASPPMLYTANDPAYHPITGYRTWAEVEADPPQFTGVLGTLPVETTCTATLTSPFGAGTYRCAQPAGHYDDTAEPTFGADGWATDIGGWHAMAGARRCVWADTADGATPHADTTTED